MHIWRGIKNLIEKYLLKAMVEKSLSLAGMHGVGSKPGHSFLITGIIGFMVGIEIWMLCHYPEKCWDIGYQPGEIGNGNSKEITDRHWFSLKCI